MVRPKLWHIDAIGGRPPHLIERYEILLSRLPLLAGAEEADTRSVKDHTDVVQGLQAALEQLEPDVLDAAGQ